MALTLYFAPMACSLASRIALYEADIPADYRRVTLQSKEIEGGGNYYDVTAKGQVPTLVLGDGTALTENAAVLQYIADLAPAGALAPAPGGFARYELQSWLSYVGSEVHKQVFWTLFAPTSPPEAKEFVKTLIPAKMAYLNGKLAGRTALVAERFSVADAYLTWALMLLKRIGTDLAAWPNVDAYFAANTERSAVRRAVSDEMALQANT
ncbi:MAG TPA: glutathione S-transferase [Alphaproteobacteria bacterium]|nr:glutathione S-transferase [Alphaproteobacteria bacterium]HAJ46096.1 glutathione S-transferase [Alphaproteobacteria bacterium]